MIIAVDFDGTIVEHKYPEIGRELPFAIETLKKLQQERHRLILWSVREDCGAASQKKVLTCSLMEYSSAFLRFFRSSDVLNPE